MAAKLKVYATRIGFHDAVVAAPNQTAALAAWDIRENLFAHGAATITQDPQAVEVATSRPGVVLRRAAGSDQPFSDAPGAPDLPELKPPRTAKAAAPTAKPPDRRALDLAERALVELADEEKRAGEDLAERRRALEDEARAQMRALSARRLALQRERDRIRRVYLREGGR